MKSLEEIKMARNKLTAEAIIPGLSKEQQMLVMGMSVALRWVSDAGGNTLTDLLAGRPLYRPDAQKN